ncbi:hypothetical protein GCM10010342_19080 [Streptomyces anulatus]|nr:hypothetical protein GCM10010342_19080 [Streptomyces anulatus]
MVRSARYKAREEGDEHYGLLAELGQYGTALWLRWHGSDVDVAVLPDCPVIGTGSGSGSGGDACGLFAGHVERHSWAEAPPQRALSPGGSVGNAVISGMIAWCWSRWKRWGGSSTGA